MEVGMGKKMTILTMYQRLPRKVILPTTQIQKAAVMKMKVFQMRISLRKRTIVMNQSASQYTWSLLNVLESHILRTHRKSG